MTYLYRCLLCRYEQTRNSNSDPKTAATSASADQKSTNNDLQIRYSIPHVQKYDDTITELIAGTRLYTGGRKNHTHQHTACCLRMNEAPAQYFASCSSREGQLLLRIHNPLTACTGAVRVSRHVICVDRSLHVGLPRLFTIEYARYYCHIDRMVKCMLRILHQNIPLVDHLNVRPVNKLALFDLLIPPVLKTDNKTVSSFIDIGYIIWYTIQTVYITHTLVTQSRCWKFANS